MKKNSLFLTMLFFSLTFTFCSEDEELIGIEQPFSISSDGSFTLDAGAADIDNNTVSTGENFDGPDPAEPEVGTSDTNDDDGDGIPDDEDNFPDVCTKMVVTSNGVSSARITLNDEELYSPNDFHNDNFSEISSVNVKDGDNTIFIRLAGSPGDQVIVQIYNCSESPVELLYETIVTRVAGSPNTN